MVRTQHNTVPIGHTNGDCDSILRCNTVLTFFAEQFFYERLNLTNGKVGEQLDRRRSMVLLTFPGAAAMHAYKMNSLMKGAVWILRVGIGKEK